MYKDNEVYLEFHSFDLEADEDQIHSADPAACIACGYKEGEADGVGKVLELKIINAVYPYPTDFVKIRLCEGCRYELKMGIDAAASH